MGNKYRSFSIDAIMARLKHRERLENRKWYNTIWPFYKRRIAADLPYEVTSRWGKRVAFRYVFRHRFLYQMKHPWEIFYDLKYELKCFFQRGFYGFACFDVGSFNIHLSEIMPHVLRQMTGEHNYSCSYKAVKEAAERLGFNPEEAWAGSTLSREESNLIMGLAIAIEDSWYDLLAETFDKYNKIMTQTLHLDFEEENKQIAECKAIFHTMIDRFEDLST